MRKKENLRHLLNLDYLVYTNLTPKVGDLDLPYVSCETVPQIDFLAGYSRPSTYNRTPNTAVEFFEYDITFDGWCGLWLGIYYGVEEIQNFFRERFKTVRYVIAPDYSKVGDGPEAENIHRQLRQRVTAIWLTMNTDAIVIPLVSAANRAGFPYMVEGMDDCKAVAFNAKGPMGDPRQLPIFRESIVYAVDHLPKLETIIVYSASPNKEKVLELFEYAVRRGIQVQIPDNTLQTRNRILGGDE